MPVIIRETREIDGKLQTVKIYRTDGLLTREAKERAEKLDLLLQRKMKERETEVTAKGLLRLKGSRGVIRLWYEVGKRLQFMKDPSVVPLEDQKHVWRALYDHAENLVPGPGRSRAENYERNHFRYCAMLAEFDWSFVKGAGNWRSWVEFFDSEKIREDPRIIEWLRERSTKKPTKDWLDFARSAKQKSFRKLTKYVRQSFKDKETTVFSATELFGKLDEIFRKALHENNG
jgi:hypothetical protein